MHDASYPRAHKAWPTAVKAATSLLLVDVAAARGSPAAASTAVTVHASSRQAAARRFKLLGRFMTVAKAQARSKLGSAAC